LGNFFFNFYYSGE